ncbi:MAG: hypothetical protein JSR91_17150 [Proteobacteria bacterium]|nr:hypothetical protein [Pseudomonadota bacterium]
MAQNYPTPIHSGTPIRSRGSLVGDLEHPLLSLHREMNRLFDDVFHRRPGGSTQDGSQQYVPMLLSIDVSETDKEIRICADLAGVSEDNIDVSLARLEGTVRFLAERDADGMAPWMAPGVSFVENRLGVRS